MGDKEQVLMQQIVHQLKQLTAAVVALQQTTERLIKAVESKGASDAKG